ncbi:MAG: pyridoxal phosphate-dependent aminotransferase [Peptoniphilaceae bacterium]|uniref:MalY/PatB family protein n=1 Tax=Parvimonas sp. TaxID=1944660 RepID=UPI002A7585E1|nr:MalY/PatB family protein [Parvimonas sp.]MDD7765581.1 pyridoxal phosphate-dependent aminotransferase [Peptoniphilaceae bacterium]MDY3051122.1 MalY/PatB family protein [Parvimonas sp.]
MSRCYNFDEYVDRKHSHAEKWNNMVSAGAPKNDHSILSMSIADMEFKCCDEILNALKEPIENGVIGYDCPCQKFFSSFVNWQKEKNNWDIKKEWIVPVPGVVPGIANTILHNTKEGDAVIVNTPVYPPFFNVINLNNRKLVENELIELDDKYVFDFEDFERKIIENDVKVSILCSPHNPVGRVWTKEELTKYGNICIKHNVLMISDEIHGDLTLKGYKHIPLASISDEFAKNTVTLSAPSKTFNIAGLAQSVAIISNDELKDRFLNGLVGYGIFHMASFAAVGFVAAYTYGKEWFKECMEYIESNIDFALEFINKELPKVKVKRPEASFLLWLDLRDYGMPHEDLHQYLINEGKLLLNSGITYGENANLFFRMNIACNREMLIDALNRLKTALNKL